MIAASYVKMSSCPSVPISPSEIPQSDTQQAELSVEVADCRWKVQADPFGFLSSFFLFLFCLFAHCIFLICLYFATKFPVLILSVVFHIYCHFCFYRFYYSSWSSFNVMSDYNFFFLSDLLYYISHHCFCHSFLLLSPSWFH